jgi:hypothetical protein
MDEAFFFAVINTEEAFSLQKRATPNLLAEGATIPSVLWRMLRLNTMAWRV